MKKLLFLTLAALLSLSAFGRHTLNPKIVDKHVTDWVIDQLKDMGYTVLPEVIVQDTLNRHGKKIEYDDLYYQPSKDGQRIKKHRRPDVDAIVDTLVKENPEITVTYNYIEEPFFYSYNIGRFYHGGFNYWMYGNPWYYSNWMYDPYDFYWDMRFSGYPYWNYPYYNNFYFGYNRWYNGWYNNWNWNHNWYGNNNNFYSHNNWNTGGFQQRPQYGRRERPSTLTSTYNRTSTQERRIAPQQNRVAPQNRTTYGESRRSYTPSYESPRLSSRPQYNNSRVSSSTENRRTQPSTQTSTYSRSPQPNIQRSEPRTQTRTYNTPSRSYGESRSYNNAGQNNGGDSRRSFNQSSSSSYSNGSRNTGTSSNFSSGGSSNSSSGGGSSSSSGGRSSGGSSSSGRR